MATVGQIREKIIEVTMRGGDTSELEKELKKKLLDEQAEEAAKAEVAKLKATGERRKAYQSAAAAVLARVRSQGEAIDQFLKGRDITLKSLDDLLADFEALQKLQDDALRQYSWPQSFEIEASKVPEGYLPNGLTCPFLFEESGMHGSEIVACTLKYLKQARGVIASAYRWEKSMPHLRQEADMAESAE